MTAIRNLIAFALLLSCVTGATVQAQSSPTPAALPVAGTDSSRADSTALVPGPRWGAAATGVRRQSQVATGLMPAQPVSMGKPMALMIVGGAAFVLGAVIGRDIGVLFMVGGAASFLIGLYQYIK